MRRHSKALAPRIETRVLNVRDPASIAAAVEGAGAVDVLFNCAGFVASGTILDCDESQWAFRPRSEHDGHVPDVPCLPARHAGTGGRSIINMASVVSSRSRRPTAVYGATKAGVIGLTKGIAADFIMLGISAAMRSARAR